MQKSTQKQNMEPTCNNTSVFLGNDEQNFPEPLRAHGHSGKECMRLLADVKKKVQQTKLHSDPGRGTRQFPFSKNHRYNK